MTEHICDKHSLKAKLDIVKSPTGINAVWNKDDNTVYYNCNIFRNNPEFEPGYNCLQKNDKIRILNPNNISEEMKDFYKAVRVSRTHHCNCENNCPNFKKVE